MGPLLRLSPRRRLRLRQLLSPRRQVVPAPVAESAPAVAPAPVAESAPAVAPAPVAESAPAVAPAPVAESAPAVAPAPVAESAPAVAPAPAVAVSLILDQLKVSVSQTFVQQTPIVVSGGTVYIANIEPGANGDSRLDLHTVVRQGKLASNGNWSWQSTVVDDQTISNVWHTAPAIGMDEQGYIHVAYNMHNFPWQYKVAAEPNSIRAFEFRGQSVTRAEIERHVYENKSSFKTLGSAAIPGNQITYPAFYNDRDGYLYVTNRFAARPAKSFPQRVMSSAIARYNTENRSWLTLGEIPAINDGDYDGGNERLGNLRSIASASGWY
ncbi:MAG: BNR-4 repeat-containing protein [Granulosicoccus sp.]